MSKLESIQIMSELPDQINYENKYQLLTDAVKNMKQQKSLKSSLRMMKPFLTDDK